MGSKLKYAFMLKRELQSAHYNFKRNGIEQLVREFEAYKKVEQRLDREKSVARSIVSSAIAMGYTVSLHDGEVWAVKQAKTVKEVLDAVQTTDCDTLRFRKQDADNTVVGSVYLVYGNSASEVMSDWSDNPETNAILKNALAQCDRYAAKGW